MSRQIPIDSYFRTKTSLPAPDIKSMTKSPNVTKKRRNLSLIKSPTPLKSKRATSKTKAVKPIVEVICLSSDDEKVESTETNSLSAFCDNSTTSDSSMDTILYSLIPKTPQKTPLKIRKTSLTSSRSSSGSPSSTKHFFSPNKKRNVVKRSLVKKNLAESFSSQKETSLVSSSSNELYKKACNGMDDKSLFFLNMVDKFLNDASISHLLNETSNALLSRCFQLVKPGIRVVCRLYWRQPGWYRREQMMQIATNKKEASDDPTLQEVINSLILNGFVTASTVTGANSVSFEEYAKLLKADELKQICKDLKLKIQSKQDAIQALNAFRRRSSISVYFTGGSATSNAKRVIDMMRIKAGTCFKLSDLARNTIYKLYLLMYVGMDYATIRDKQLELMLINDKVSRETFPVDKEMEMDSASVVFRNKDEFDKYLQAHLMHETYLTETQICEKCKVVSKVYKLYKEIKEEDLMRYKTLPEWLQRFTPANLYIKVLESGIQDLKKDKSGLHYQLALDILTMLTQQVAFRQHKRAEWFAEQALILHKLLFRHDEAAKVLIEGLTSSMPDEMKDVMRPRAIKLAKQQNIEFDKTLRTSLLEHARTNLILENKFPADHVSKQPMENYKQRGKKIFEIHMGDEKKFLDCEEYCVVHYTTNGPFTHGEHWEGRIVTTIFALLFWDIIYTKPVGATGIFLSHYQMHPLDIWTESFYNNRKTVIDDRLRSIERMAVDTLVDIMRTKWEERPEHELSPINRSLGWDNVRMVASCLGAQATAAICRRLATNYARARSGFPDLTLWNAATKKIKFVEVKTDTDKPSMKQLQWMKYLSTHGIDTGFCYVGVNTTRCKARAEPARSMRDAIQFEN